MFGTSPAHRSDLIPRGTIVVRLFEPTHGERSRARATGAHVLIYGFSGVIRLIWVYPEDDLTPLCLFFNYISHGGIGGVGRINTLMNA